MDDTDKIVAAILAAGRVATRGPEAPVDDYVAEYEAFLIRMEQMKKKASSYTLDNIG